MRISCPVCQEIVNNDVSCAPCGHVFHYHCLMHWLEMKKPPSCPQCRRACPISKIIRLYIEEHIDVELDPSATSDELKSSLRTALESVKARENDIQELQEEVQQLNDRSEKMCIDRQADQIEISDLRKQTHKLKKIADNADVMHHKNLALHEEIRSLTVQLQAAESMSTVLEGTPEEVANIVKNYSNCANSMEALAKFLISTKKEFESLKSKHKEACNLKDRQAKHLAVEKAKIAELQRKIRDSAAFRESLEGEVRSLETERDSLKHQLNQLRRKHSFSVTDMKPTIKRKRSVEEVDSSPTSSHSVSFSEARSGDSDDDFSPPPKAAAKHVGEGLPSALHRKAMATQVMKKADENHRPSRGSSDYSELHTATKEHVLPLRAKESSSSIQGLLMRPQTAAHMSTIRRGYNGFGGQSKFHVLSKDNPAKQSLKLGQKSQFRPKPPSLQLGPYSSGVSRGSGSASAAAVRKTLSENTPPLPNLPS